MLKYLLIINKIDQATKIKKIDIKDKIGRASCRERV